MLPSAVIVTVYVTCSYSGQLKGRKVHMVPENEFHHKEQPVRSATPGTVQNGPGNAGKTAGTAASAGKTEEGAADDSGEFGTSRSSPCCGNCPICSSYCVN